MQAIEEISVFIPLTPHWNWETSTRKAPLSSHPSLKDFLDHCCQQRHHSFCIKKCGDANCNICKPPRLPLDIFLFTTFQILLQHLMVITSHSLMCTVRPQLKPTDPHLQSELGEQSLPFVASVKHVRNVALMIHVQCEECGMWRLLYSPRKLSSTARQNLVTIYYWTITRLYVVQLSVIWNYQTAQAKFACVIYNSTTHWKNSTIQWTTSLSVFTAVQKITLCQCKDAIPNARVANTKSLWRKYVTLSMPVCTRRQWSRRRGVNVWETRWPYVSCTVHGHIIKAKPKVWCIFSAAKETKLVEGDLVWYDNQVVGVNTLGSKMKPLSRQAQLSKDYTNHSICATSVTILNHSGVEARHIKCASGHKSESNIRSYASKTSDEIKLAMSSGLSNALCSRPISPIVSWTSPFTLCKREGLVNSRTTSCSRGMQ